MSKKHLAIIPARGGSQCLPGKNIKKLKGVPLIAYSIRAALKSCNISRVIVSTDDDEIARLARRYGSEVIMRPAYLARADSLMVSVILHSLNALKTKEGYIPDKLILLQPTSPLRTVRHIDEAFSILRYKNCDSVISVCQPDFHPLKSFKINKRGFLKGLVSPAHCFALRQDLPKAYVSNGAIYLIKTSTFIKEGSLLTSKTFPYIMSPWESVDIDSIVDFEYAAYLLNMKKRYAYLKNC